MIMLFNNLLFLSLSSLGVRQEQDLYVRLIDSVTKAVSSNIYFIYNYLSS